MTFDGNNLTNSVWTIPHKTLPESAVSGKYAFYVIDVTPAAADDTPAFPEKPPMAPVLIVPIF